VTLLCANSIFGQSNERPNDAKSLQVYISCGSSGYLDCQTTYLKTKITWAYFVQDQFVADVNVRMNALTTGSGGQQYQMIFEGLKSLQGLKDTVEFEVIFNSTENEIREEIRHHVELGLIRYALYLDKHAVLNVHSSDSSDHTEMGEGTNPDEDPFHAWVYNLSAQSYSNGQEVTQFLHWGTRASASQVTEKQKFMFSVNYNKSINHYNYQGVESTYKLGSIYSSALATFSLNNHWSWGTFNSYIHSDYDNYKSAYSANLAVEYNIFPYKNSQTKQLTFSTYLGGDYNFYKQKTIYFKDREFRPIGQFRCQGYFNQSWGSVSFGLSHVALLNEWKLNNTNINANIDARIYKGFSISLYASASLIRNQINLPLNGASMDEVLLQQQVLATNYSYYSSISFNYRFGSIYNNVVNTRFQNEF
jgi:hypothetical protein